jgi:hypothetical protein
MYAGMLNSHKNLDRSEARRVAFDFSGPPLQQSNLFKFYAQGVKIQRTGK